MPLTWAIAQHFTKPWNIAEWLYLVSDKLIPASRLQSGSGVLVWLSKSEWCILWYLDIQTVATYIHILLATFTLSSRIALSIRDKRAAVTQDLQFHHTRRSLPTSVVWIKGYGDLCRNALIRTKQERQISLISCGYEQSNILCFTRYSETSTQKVGNPAAVLLQIQLSVCEKLSK